MRKISIVEINPSLNMGGIESMIVQLCNHLDNKNYTVSFLSLSNDMAKASELNDYIRRDSLGYNPSKLTGRHLILNFIPAIRRLGRWLRKNNPDIVHIHAYFSMYLLIAIAIKLYLPSSKVVKTVHTSGLFYSSSKLIDHFRLWVEKRATALNNTYIVGISEQVYKQVVKCFSKTSKGIFKIYNGINPSDYYHSPNDKLRDELLYDKKILVGYVARIVKGKNHLFLLDLWKEMKDEGLTNAALMFIGDGELTERIKNDIKRMHLQNDVILIGRSSDVPKLLSICDIAVFPSDYEGFSIAMLEKMASNLPIVASDIAPFKEIIDSDKNGFTIPLADKNKWKGILKKLLQNKKLREDIGKAARLRSQDFSIQIMIENYQNLYGNVYHR